MRLPLGLSTERRLAMRATSLFSWRVHGRQTGGRHPLCPRSLLNGCWTGPKHGLAPRSGFEYEFFVFHETRIRPEKRYKDLKPLTPGNFAIPCCAIPRVDIFTLMEYHDSMGCPSKASMRDRSRVIEAAWPRTMPCAGDRPRCSDLHQVYFQKRQKMATSWPNGPRLPAKRPCTRAYHLKSANRLTKGRPRGMSPIMETLRRASEIPEAFLSCRAHGPTAIRACQGRLGRPPAPLGRGEPDTACGHPGSPSPAHGVPTRRRRRQSYLWPPAWPGLLGITKLTLGEPVRQRYDYRTPADDCRLPSNLRDSLRNLRAPERWTCSAASSFFVTISQLARMEVGSMRKRLPIGSWPVL